jgi:hypothetical protein
MKTLLFIPIIVLLASGCFGPPPPPPAQGPVSGASNMLKIIRFEPNVPATLHPGDKLFVYVRYRVESVDQARIFVRPITHGEPTPGYKAHGSPVYDRGESEMVGWFTFDKPTKVHEVRIQMVDAGKPDHVIAEIWQQINSQWIKP